MRTGYFIEINCDEYMNTWLDKAIFLAKVEEKPDAIAGTIGAIPTYHILEPVEYAKKISGFCALRFRETVGPARKLTYEEYCQIVRSIES